MLNMLISFTTDQTMEIFFFFCWSFIHETIIFSAWSVSEFLNDLIQSVRFFSGGVMDKGSECKIGELISNSNQVHYIHLHANYSWYESISSSLRTMG